MKRTTEFAASITGDADGAVAALEKVKVRVQETTRAAESANTKVANSTELVVKNSEKAARGVAAITQALYALESEGSARVLAVGASVGNFADLLGPGGKVVSGIAIVTSSIAALFLKAREESAKTTQAIEDDVKRLVNAGDFAAITKRLQEIDQGTAGEGFADGRNAIRERIEQLTEEANAVGQSARYYRERQQSIIDERKRLAELTAEYNRYYKALTDTTTGARAPRGLAGQAIAVTADSPDKLAADAKKAAAAVEELDKQARALDESLRKAATVGMLQSIKSLEELNEATGKRLTFQLQQITAEEDLNQAREKSIQDLRAELTAVQAGADAYAEYNREKARQDYIDDEVAKAQTIALREGKQLTAEQTVELEASAAFAFDLAESVRAAVDALAESQGFDGVGGLAEGLSIAASAAAGIAAGLGESGRAFGALIGQSAQLLTNLSRAQRAGIFKDKDGKDQNVGFLGALTGKAGAAGVGAAASSALGAIGATVAVAEALDLFGNRARERARQLRENAIAFNKALEDYAITSRTQLEDQLRQNIASANELVKQAAAATGVTLNNGVDLKSVDDLNRIIESIRSVPLVNKILGGFATQLERLAETAAKNETLLREQQATALGRLNEDLAVRRVALALGAEAGDQERARLEIERQEIEIRKQFGPIADEYIQALRDITAAEQAAAAATRERVRVLQQAEDDNAILGGTTSEKLQRGLGAFVQGFADRGFAELFQGLDLSTSEGIKAARAQFVSIYQQLAADGIDESERPIIDFIKSFIGQLDSALAELPDVFDGIATQLEGFAARVELFGLSLGEQLAQLKIIFAGQFGEAFDSLLQSADLGTPTGRAEFKNRIETQLAEILKDNVITAEEQPFYDALLQFLGLVNQALDDAAADAQASVAAASAARQQQRTRAGNRIDLYDLDGVAAFQTTLDGIGGAFSDLFEQFDLESLEGIDGAKGVIRGIFDALDSLSDEELFAKFGLTRDELLTALLDTDAGLDGLKGALVDVTTAAKEAAAASAEFSTNLNQDFLRSQGRDQEADRFDAAARRDARVAQATQLGLGPDKLQQIEAIYQADLEKIAKQYAVTLGTFAGESVTATTSSGAAGGSGRRTGNTTVVGDFGGLSEITAQSLAGLLREIAINTSREGAIVAAVLGRGSSATLSSLRFPSFPQSGGGGATQYFNITVHVGAVSSGALSPAAAGQAVAREISKEMGRLATAEVRYLGSGVA